MKNNKNKKKIIIILTLIIAVFASSYLLAKYISSAYGLDNPKNVAKWSIEYLDNENASKNLNLIYGNDTNTQSYILKINSTSEVSAKYSVILNNVPSEMQVKIDNGDFQTPTNNKITFTSANYKINVSDSTKTKTHTLTFKVPIDKEIPSTNEIDIDLNFEQMD